MATAWEGARGYGGYGYGGYGGYGYGGGIGTAVDPLYDLREPLADEHRFELKADKHRYMLFQPTPDARAPLLATGADGRADLALRVHSCHMGFSRKERVEAELALERDVERRMWEKRDALMQEGVMDAPLAEFQRCEGIPTRAQAFARWCELPARDKESYGTPGARAPGGARRRRRKKSVPAGFRAHLPGVPRAALVRAWEEFGRDVPDAETVAEKLEVWELMNPDARAMYAEGDE